jgi:hypothetical protein
VEKAVKLQNPALDGFVGLLFAGVFSLFSPNTIARVNTEEPASIERGNPASIP